MAARTELSDPTSSDGSVPPAKKPRRIRFPRIDFVTLMLAVLAAIILLFLTSELWMSHAGG